MESWLYKVVSFVQFARSNRINNLRCAKVMLKSGGESMAIYGYARVSTKGQSLESQEAAMTSTGSLRGLVSFCVASRLGLLFTGLAREQ
jgi:hypothetical protein